MEWIVLAAVLLIVGGGGYWFYRSRTEQIAPPAKPEISASPTTEPEKSVAAETADIAEAVAEAPEVEIEPPVEAATLRSALGKTRSSFWGRISGLFGGNAIDGDLLEEIEEVLYTSDLGPATVQRLMEAVNSSSVSDADSVREALKQEMLTIFDAVTLENSSASELLSALKFADEGPTVWMIVGVNGAGKTTSIGKVAAQLNSLGKKVMIVAGDTFRAAAVEQLEVWAQRAGAEFYSDPNVTDPSAIAFQGCERALAAGVDVILIDTAGRLHTQANLMEELKKMKRVIDKKVPGSPHESLIVLDSNSGQNALIQAKEFHQALELDGVILTKLDGTAKGGVAVGVACELELPVKLVGVGEKVQDLRAFSSGEFVDSLF